MSLSIAVSSGKGGTGKTLVSMNIASVFAVSDQRVCYLDCDVEEPNGHLFLKPIIVSEEDVLISSPVGVDASKCTLCGKCVWSCRYNAIALVNKKILFFRNLCHVCGACEYVCPAGAIKTGERKIGELKTGASGDVKMAWGLLETGEGGMSPRLIRRVKEHAGGDIVILDSPPGTSCPVVETVKDADICVLVTDPTPFGINDLKLAVYMCREIGKEPVVLVNRADYMNAELKDYCEAESLEIIGEIPDDRRIAECYSIGNLVVEGIQEYRSLFEDIAARILARAYDPKPVQTARRALRGFETDDGQTDTEAAAGDGKVLECTVRTTVRENGHGREIVVISGKGGTGKTSIVAAFCALGKNIAVADCDVDAADLHLVLKPKILEEGAFSGGTKAEINLSLCTGCGLCREYCRFGAIDIVANGSISLCTINQTACEGCGMCDLVCAAGAISSRQVVNGEWFVSETRFGPMSHAKLGVAQDNSGKLVSLIRKKKDELSEKRMIRKSVLDGSPGTGCPVIASITGAAYAVIVTEPTVSGVHDLIRVLDLTGYFHIRAGIIVNKHDINPDKTAEIRKVAESTGADWLGVIPYDKSVTEAQMMGLSVVEYNDGPAARSIKNIWSSDFIISGGK